MTTKVKTYNSEDCSLRAAIEYSLRDLFPWVLKPGEEKINQVELRYDDKVLILNLTHIIDQYEKTMI